MMAEGSVVGMTIELIVKMVREFVVVVSMILLINKDTNT